MTDLDQYRAALAPYAGMRVLAAWVAGSHAHGVADKDSDIDLKIVVAPNRRGILLNRADWTIALHDPDITVTTPAAFLKQLLKGTPNALEALTIPIGCDLVDRRFLTRLAMFAPSLATRMTVDAALGNAKANMHMLERRADLDERRTRKITAETMRLLSNAVIVAGGGAWRATTPDVDDQRAVRTGMQGADLPKLYQTAFDAAAIRPPQPLDPDTRDTVEDIMEAMMFDAVNGTGEYATVDEVLDRLKTFTDRL